MPFIPHTEDDVKAMLAAIGVTELATLFDEIPPELHCAPLDNIPSGINEMSLNNHVKALCRDIDETKCFIGAGAYEHHIPALVWDIVSRGEFLTAYTPYQAEASQGTLQLLYEFQTMMASLTGLDVSNASLYDGASALAEAVLMAVRVNKKSKSRRVLVFGGLHPHYLETITTIVSNQAIEIVPVPFNDNEGVTTLADLKAFENEDITACVIQQPNFFGLLQDVDALCNWAHGQGAVVVSVVNPTSLALLKAPGDWGDNGADIVCGEGQPLGVPLASGGPYFGFLTTKQSHIRQMPGRLVGRTIDRNGKEGFTLTLQAREQHIRRSKAKSNICTNQGLLVTAATIYMSAVGFHGLKQVALLSHENTKTLRDLLKVIPGVKQRFQGHFFHELVIDLPVDVSKVIAGMQHRHIACGVALKPYFKELSHSLLLCVTETKTHDDLVLYADTLAKVIKEVS